MIKTNKTHWRFFFCLFLSLLILPSLLPAQSSSSVTNVFLGDWIVAGPFPANSPDVSIFEDESALDPDPRETIRFGEQTFVWRRIEGAGFLELDRAISPDEENNWCIAYAITHVDVPEEGLYVLAIGADDCAYAWWNGEQVVESSKLGNYVPDADQVLVWARRGSNRLVVKIYEQLGPWRVGARLLHAFGKAVVIDAYLDRSLDSKNISPAKLTSRPDKILEPPPRRLWPLSELMSQAPLPRLTFEIVDPKGRVADKGAVDGFGGYYSISLPAGAIPSDFDALDGWRLRGKVVGPGADPNDFDMPLRERMRLNLRGTKSLFVQTKTALTDRPLGKVFVEAGESPVPGLMLQGWSDDRGEWRTSGLLPGLIAVRAGMAEFAPALQYVLIDDAAPQTAATLGLDGAAPMTALGVLGHAGGATGPPMGGAIIRYSVYDAPAIFTIADAQGNFSLHSVEGSVPLTIQQGAYVSWMQRVLADADKPSRTVMSLARRTISGRVVDAGGNPAAQAHVAIKAQGLPRGFGTRTNENGEFANENSLTDPLLIVMWTQEDVDWTSLGANEQAPGREWNINAPVKLDGRVAGPNGEPLEGLTVSVSPDEANSEVHFDATSRADGRFEFPMHFPRKSMWLQVWSGEGPERRAVVERTLAAGESNVALVVADPIARQWLIAVRDAATSAPVAAAELRFEWRPGASVEITDEIAEALHVRQVGPGLFEAFMNVPKLAENLRPLAQLRASAPGYLPSVIPALDASSLPAQSSGVRIIPLLRDLQK